MSVSSPSFQIYVLLFLSLFITGSCPYISMLAKLLIHRLSFYFISKKIHFLGSLYDFPFTFPSPTSVCSRHIYSIDTHLSSPGAELHPDRPGSSLWSTATCQAKKKKEEKSSIWFLACSLLCPVPCFSLSGLSSKGVIGQILISLVSHT